MSTEHKIFTNSGQKIKKIGCHLSKLNSISCLLVFTVLRIIGGALPLPGLQVRIGREREAGTW